MTVQIVSSLREIGLLAGHVGRLDLTNVALGLRHAGQLWRALDQAPDAAVYVPLSQERWGFLRDAVFVAVARLRRRRVILHLHGGNLQSFYWNARFPIRWAIRGVCGQAEQAWVLTPALSRQFEGLVAERRVRCVENVVPDPPCTDEPDEPEGRPFRLLYLSNLLPEKGCFDLIEAIRSLNGAAADWEVRIVGSGTPEVTQRLERELANLSDNAASVRMLGALHGEKKNAQFRWADAFVYPSYYPLEGQPLVLLEALAAGLPIVSTRHAGIPETARHGIEALLVEPRDVGGLASSLGRVAEDIDTRAQFGRRARERYEARYSSARLVRDLERALGCGPGSSSVA
jgi:glycosyltransferase involved in cell wall biosynthesis